MATQSVPCGTCRRTSRNDIVASEYQLVAQLPGMTMQTVQRMRDQAFVPFDPANRDYAAYCAWLAEGNMPDPAPELHTPDIRPA